MGRAQRAAASSDGDAAGDDDLDARMNRGAIALGLVTIVAGGTVFFVHHNQKKDRQVKCCTLACRGMRANPDAQHRVRS